MVDSPTRAYVGSRFPSVGGYVKFLYWIRFFMRYGKYGCQFDSDSKAIVTLPYSLLSMYLLFLSLLLHLPLLLALST